MVTIDNLGFSYCSSQGTTTLFKGCSHTFSDGCIHAVIGHSGCGKTTLLYLLAGLLKSEEGCLMHGSIDLSKGPIERAIILQDFGLLPWKRVDENIALGLKVKGMDASLRTEKVVSMMKEVGIDHLSTYYPSQLSGGEKQRCAIARAVIVQPKLLLMDEPFSALDAMNRESMQELLVSIQKKHAMTCIMVTHSIEEAAYLSDFIHVLTRGERGSVFLSPIKNSHPNGVERKEYRKSSEYFALCVKLRGLLEKEGAR